VKARQDIADYRDIPQTLTTRSGSTPPGGINAEIVLVRDAEKTLADIAANDLRGKLVLVETLGGRPPSAKVISMAKQSGAVGILRDDIPELGKGPVHVHIGDDGSVLRNRPDCSVRSPEISVGGSSEKSGSHSESHRNTNAGRRAGADPRRPELVFHVELAGQRTVVVGRWKTRRL